MKGKTDPISAEEIGQPFQALVVGEGNRKATKVANLIPGEIDALSFCKYTGTPEDRPQRSREEVLNLISESRSSIVFCSVKLGDLSFFEGKTLLIVTEPRLAFSKAAEMFFLEGEEGGHLHPTALISENAKIDPTAVIGPYCVIGDEVEVGPKSVLVAHVSIVCPTKIGRNVRIWPGTVIGADGFGYDRGDKGELYKFPHVGGVVIEDEVEIGSNTSIDRGALGDTVIGEGTKIDNLVHVAHNVILGKHCWIVCHAVLGGSVKVGDCANIGIAGITKNQVVVGDGATIGMGAVVLKDVAPGEVVFGNPAHPREARPPQ